jgi:hypothetical protein
MAEQNDVMMIRVNDSEVGEMLKKLAGTDMRSMGMETAFLIRQEYARRFSQPNPLVTVEEAQQAATATQ